MNRNEFLINIINKKIIDKEIYEISKNIDNFPFAFEILKKIDGSIHLDSFLQTQNEQAAILSKGDLYRENIAFIHDSKLKNACKIFLNDLLDQKILLLKKRNLKYQKSLESKNKKEIINKKNNNKKSNNLIDFELFNVGKELLNKKDYYSAEKLFSKAIFVNPSNDKYYFFRA